MPARTGYSRTQIALHWIVFGLIAQQFLFRDAMSEAWDSLADDPASAFDPLVLAHVAGGAAVLVLVLWRLAIRVRHGAPAPVEGTKVQAFVAKLTHGGLYALLILMPLSGAVAWFGSVDAAAQGHNVMKVILLALVAIHLVGVLHHHFVLRDGTLARMRRAGG